MQQRTLVVYGNQQIGDEIAKALVSKEVKRLQEENRQLQDEVNMQKEFRHIEQAKRTKRICHTHMIKTQSKARNFFEICMAMTVVVPEYISTYKTNRYRSAAKRCGSIRFFTGGTA